MERYVGVLGILAIFLVTYLCSSAKKAIQWRTVVWGFGLQLIIAFVVLKTEMGQNFFQWINDVIVSLLGSAKQGASFVFGGNLVEGTAPIVEKTAEGQLTPISSGWLAQTGFVFAFVVIPTIIFFASFMAVLYHLGIMGRVIKGISKVMEKTMKTSGAESLSAAANIFLGQTEAPLAVRPFLSGMTNSELMAIMVGGFATVSGSVMAAYVGFLAGGIDNIAGHLLAASVMAAPCGLMLTKLLMPETEQPATAGGAEVVIERPDRNIIDAAARGAGEGLQLSLNVAAMVIAFLGIIAVADGLLGWLGGFFHYPNLSVSLILGKLFAPVAWLIGVEWADCLKIGNLIGTKMVANEFVAFLDLKQLADTDAISDRSMIIASYALCGFANFGSIGIQLGGLGALAPSRRHDLARLGFKAMLVGTAVSLITASIAGLLIMS